MTTLDYQVPEPPKSLPVRLFRWFLRNWMAIVGWFFSAIPILMMGPLAIAFALTKMDMVREGAVKNGYQPHHAPIIIGLEIACAIVYAIPQTAVLGAILLTGYLGGATATHVRIDDPAWFAPVLFGVITWLGLYFRDARVRALIPLRRVDSLAARAGQTLE